MKMATQHRFAHLLCVAGIVGTWPVAAVQRNGDTATGTTGLGASSTKTYPSGLAVTYSVTGDNLRIDDNRTTLAMAAGATAAMFTPNLPLATTGVRLRSGDVPCVFANAALAVACPAGTLVVRFSRPVTDPVLHFGANGSQSILGSSVTSGRAVHALSAANPAGITLSMAGNAVNLVVRDGITLDLAEPRYNGNDCTAFAAPVTRVAGCGSVRIRGTVASVAFDVTHAGVRNGTSAPSQVSPDAYVVTATVDEDFGDAPTSYDAGAAASHLVGGLRLGAMVDADNTAVFNDAATPVASSPNAVAAGGDNNGTAGDGADDDGLSTVPPLHAGLVGRTYTLTPAIGGATAPGMACGWIDFDRDGSFGSAERACAAFAAGATSAALAWTVPDAFASGRTHARLRVSHDVDNVRHPTGRVDSGEVEDYMIEAKPAVRVVKVLHPAGDPGRFALSIGGSTFAAEAGDGGDTGFRTVYHHAAAGAPDVMVASDIATAPVTIAVAEAPAAAGGTYISEHACVDGSGATVAAGAGTAVGVTLPASTTGAAANGRAQNVTCTFTNRRAAMTVAKHTPTAVIDAPGVIAYTIVVANAGAAALTGVNLVDTLPGGARGATAFVSGDVDGNGALDAGEAWTYAAAYTATQADIDTGANLVNHVAVTTAQIATPQTASATTAVARRPSMTVAKTTPVAVVGAPHAIPYTIAVANAGNVALTNVLPVDTLPDGSIGAVTRLSGDTDADDRLDVGETWTYGASYAATQADIDAGSPLVNRVAVTSAQTPQPVAASATTTIRVGPELAVAKTTPTTRIGAPGTIAYEIVLINAGNVALSGIALVDTMPDGSIGTVAFVSGDADGDGQLDLDETWTWRTSYVATQADIDAGATLVNTVRATATQVPTPVTASATTAIDVDAALAVAKTTPTTRIGAPGTIAYEIVLVNAGNVALSGIALVDTMPDGSIGAVAFVSGDADGDGQLDLDETWTWRASYVATQADIDAGATLVNTVRATAAQVPAPVTASAETAVVRPPSPAVPIPALARLALLALLAGVCGIAFAAKRRYRR